MQSSEIQQSTDHDYHLPDNIVPQEQNTDHDYYQQTVRQQPAAEVEMDPAVEEPAQPVADNPNNLGDPPLQDNAADVADALAVDAAPETDNPVSPAPPKKRKRFSANTPRVKNKSDGEKDNKSDGDDDEDDGLTCPICLDSWEMSGEHRLVSLKCGHLFGESCIKRWLIESARNGLKSCPQCKTRAANKDVRCLYAKRIRAIDRSEEQRLREQLDQEKGKCINLQTELATVKISYTIVMSKMQKLESENERLKNYVKNNFTGGVSNAGDISSPEFVGRLLNYKLFMEKNIEISKEPGCRVMVFAAKSNNVIVSQKSIQNLFPGYGLRFIDTPSFKPSHFLYVSAKPVRDITLNSDQNLLSAASMEQKAKLFDMRTKSVASLFSPGDKSIWACAMDCNERENFLYLGAQHGSTYVYDIRFPETVVSEFKTEGDLSPVINIAPVPVNKQFPGGGFLVCKLQSIWFYEYTAPDVTSTKLNIEGPFISMTYEATNETLLVFARSSTRYSQSRYIFGKLEKINDFPVFNVTVSFFGSKATPVMSRCSQIAVENNMLIAGYIQDAKLLSLFDVRRAQRLQSMPVQDVVYDTCPIYVQNSTYLAALTETKCRIYKVIST